MTITGSRHEAIILELGSGSSRRIPDSTTVDILNLPGVDIVSDALTFLLSLEDGSVDEIHSSHFLEHIDDPVSLLRESSRVLRAGGQFHATVPHFSNPHFYSDPTHRSFFGLYTFGYWVRSTPFRRKTPQYIEPLPFDLTRASHVFKSSRPFYVRHVLKKIVSAWVNRARWTQEFYEEHLCWLMPCYEIVYVLRRAEPEQTHADTAKAP